MFDNNKVLLEGRGNLAIMVMNEIMERIIVNENDSEEQYLPTEIQLTQIFDVSRITIREALKGLEERGFIERQHGKGAKIINKSVEVATNSLHSMMVRTKANQFDLLEARKTIELETARLAALRADDEDLLLLKDAIDGMRNKNATQADYIESDLKFHLGVAKASKNQILESVMSALQPLIYEEIVRTLKNDYRPELDENFHINIYNKIREKDSVGAVNGMKEHLNKTEKMLMLYQNKA